MQSALDDQSNFTKNCHCSSFTGLFIYAFFLFPISHTEQSSMFGNIFEW